MAPYARTRETMPTVCQQYANNCILDGNNMHQTDTSDLAILSDHARAVWHTLLHGVLPGPLHA